MKPDADGRLTCRTCGFTGPATAEPFVPSRTSWRRDCRACLRAAARRKREASRRKREASRRWREANPERRREAYRRWAKANPERRRETQRRWRQANPERVRATQRDWRAANPERRRAVDRHQRAAHPDKRREQNRRRDARKHANLVERVSYARIFERDGGRCVDCGRALLLKPGRQPDGSLHPDRVEFDHDVCVAYKRGPHVELNIVCRCARDHRAKTSQDIRDQRAHKRAIDGAGYVILGGVPPGSGPVVDLPDPALPLSHLAYLDPERVCELFALMDEPVPPGGPDAA